MTKKVYIIVSLFILALVSWMMITRERKPVPVKNVQPTGEGPAIVSVPPWKPNLPVDIERIYAQAKQITGGNMQFAVFEHGTVAYFGFSMNNTADSARSTLRKIVQSVPAFKPTRMADGHYMVEYDQPAFTLVFKEDLEKRWNYIDRHYAEGICPGETPPAQADSAAKIGLLARAMMFLDAQSPKVVKVFDPVGKLH